MGNALLRYKREGMIALGLAFSAENGGGRWPAFDGSGFVFGEHSLALLRQVPDLNQAFVRVRVVGQGALDLGAFAGHEFKVGGELHLVTFPPPLFDVPNRVFEGVFAFSLGPHNVFPLQFQFLYLMASLS